MAIAKRVILLSCRSPFVDDSKIYCPLANLYIKSYLNAYAPSVEVVIGDDNYDLNDIDSLEAFDLVGISIMTPQRDEALGLARGIKGRWPHKIIVAGGPHVKHYLAELLPERCYTSWFRSTESEHSSTSSPVKPPHESFDTYCPERRCLRSRGRIGGVITPWP